VQYVSQYAIHDCKEQFSSCYSLLGQEERWSYVHRPVRCLFEFALRQMYRILDVHLVLYSCARGQGRLNRTERTISHWSINRDLDRVIHITRHNDAYLLSTEGREEYKSCDSSRIHRLNLRWPHVSLRRTKTSIRIAFVIEHFLTKHFSKWYRSPSIRNDRKRIQILTLYVLDSMQYSSWVSSSLLTTEKTMDFNRECLLHNCDAI
jgi:hypothetical protein